MALEQSIAAPGCSGINHADFSIDGRYAIFDPWPFAGPKIPPIVGVGSNIPSGPGSISICRRCSAISVERWPIETMVVFGKISPSMP
jgi:hypothetical protein